MNEKTYALYATTAIAASLLLSGCQTLTGYQQIDKADTAEMWAGQINPIAGEVNIACEGTYHCEITQIDQTMVVSPDSHSPVNATMLTQMSGINTVNNATSNKRSVAKLNQAPLVANMGPLLNQNSVKVVPLSASGIKKLTNYYVRVKPAKREVHVNFYPENNLGYVERFAIIHDFMQPGLYQLRAYRNKSLQDSGSLLESASPNPLCIDLLQNDSVKRRFCKQPDTEHEGEFVEIGMVSKTVSKTKTIPKIKG